MAETRSVGRLIGIAAAISSVIIVVLVAVAAYLVNRVATDRRQSIVARLPQGWSDSVRAQMTVPAATLRLALERTEDINGATVVWDSAVPAPASAGAALEQFLRANGTDTSAVRRAAADPRLDAWVGYARATRWESLDLALQHSDSSVAHNLMNLRIPLYAGIRAAGAGLAARSRVRLMDGDRVGARADARAVLGLGDWMMRREPTMIGLVIGRRLLRYGAEALVLVASAEGDSATAAEAAALAAWAANRRLLHGAMIIPDSALAFARDTALALGWRSESMSAAVLESVSTPSGIVFGVPRRIRLSLAGLEGRGDADMARLIRMASATAAWLDGLGPRQRMRLMGTAF